MKSRRRQQIHLAHRGLWNRKAKKLRKLWMRGPGGDYARCGESMVDMLLAAASVVGP